MGEGYHGMTTTINITSGKRLATTWCHITDIILEFAIIQVAAWSTKYGRLVNLQKRFKRPSK